MQHLIVTCLVALGTNLSALWILIANGWMQNPVGARFNVATMRMEVTDFIAVLFNPVAQAKFVHTVSAGYVTGSMFVLSISAFYLLRGRHRGLAMRSMTVAASFGLASALSVVVLGDESGYTAGQNQKMKIAAIEAMWQTEPAPASFTVFGIPDIDDARTTDYADPGSLGARPDRHALDRRARCPASTIWCRGASSASRSGMIAYGALRDAARASATTPALRAQFDAHVDDLGYALLLKRYTPNVTDATRAQIDAAALDTVPPVPPLFWSLPHHGGARLLLHRAVRHDVLARVARARSNATAGCCRCACGRCRCPGSPPNSAGSSPKYGRQPWTIDGVLPTFLSVSSVPACECLDLARRLRAVLLGAGGGRGVPDGAHHPARPGRARRRRRPAPAAAAARIGAARCPTTKSCACSGGRCSACC